MIAQLGIAICGLVAIALTQSSCSRRRRWAPLFGLAGQPFWLYATATSDQIGMLTVSCAYTVIWIVGACGMAGTAPCPMPAGSTGH